MIEGTMHLIGADKYEGVSVVGYKMSRPEHYRRKEVDLTVDGGSVMIEGWPGYIEGTGGILPTNEDRQW